MQENSLLQTHWTRRQCVAVSLLGLLSLLTGCGGGSSSPPAQAIPGRLVVEIVWPAPSRLIPAATNLIRVRVLLEGLEIARQDVSRPAGDTVSQVVFDQLPAASLLVVGEAIAKSQDVVITEKVLASGQFPINLTAGQSNPLTMTLGSTITRIDLYPTNFNDLLSNSSDTVYFTARNAQNQYLLLTTAQLEWTSSNPAVAIAGQVTDSFGYLTYQGTGTTTLTLRDRESGISGTSNLRVIAAAPAPGVRLIVDIPPHLYQFYDASSNSIFSIRATTGGGCEFTRVSWDTGAITSVATMTDRVHQMAPSPKQGRFYFVSRNSTSTVWRLGYFVPATGTLTFLPTPSGSNSFRAVHAPDTNDELVVVYRNLTQDVALYDPTTQTVRALTFLSNYPRQFLPTENPSQFYVYQDGYYSYWLTRLAITSQGLYPQDNEIPRGNVVGNIPLGLGTLLYSQGQIFTTNLSRLDPITYSYQPSLLPTNSYGNSGNFCINPEATRGYYLNGKFSFTTTWYVAEFDLNTGQMLARKELFGFIGNSTETANFVTWCGPRQVIVGALNGKQLALLDFSVF